MSYRVCCATCCLASVSMAFPATATMIDLQNAVDGSASLTMSPQFSADVNLVIITSSVDTNSVCFVNAFLNTDNDLAEVVEVTSGQPEWTYDRTSFTLPAAIDETGGNEYGLVSGSQDGSAKLPLGGATHVIDILTLETQAEVGSTAVTFELGARAPQVFGPPPTYVPFTICSPPWCNFPNMLYIGDSSGSNSAFIINYIPEPVCILLVAAALLVLGRPQSADRVSRNSGKGTCAG